MYPYIFLQKIRGPFSEAVSLSPQSLHYLPSRNYIGLDVQDAEITAMDSRSLGDRGLGFRVQGLGFGVQGLGLRV